MEEVEAPGFRLLAVWVQVPRARPARSRPEKSGEILQPSLVVSFEGLWVTQASVRPGGVEDVARVLARTPDHVVVCVIAEVGDDV